MAENIEDTELTITEFAASLRVSEDTARTLVLNGEVPARKQGRQWRILRSDVEAYKQRLRDKRQRDTDSMKAVRPEEVE